MQIPQSTGKISLLAACFPVQGTPGMTTEFGDHSVLAVNKIVLMIMTLGAIGRTAATSGRTSGSSALMPERTRYLIQRSKSFRNFLGLN